jgi:hypothetical protein
MSPGQPPGRPTVKGPGGARQASRRGLGVVIYV